MVYEIHICLRAASSCMHAHSFRVNKTISDFAIKHSSCLSLCLSVYMTPSLRLRNIHIAERKSTLELAAAAAASTSAVDPT